MTLAQSGLHYSQGLLTAGATMAIFGIGVGLLAQVRIMTRRASPTRLLGRLKVLDRTARAIPGPKRRLLAQYAIGDPDATMRMQRITQLLCLIAVVVGVFLGGLAFIV
jgi:hypothetical protein